MSTATLSLQVTQTGLAPAANNLDKLGKAAQTYRADIYAVAQTLAGLGGNSTRGLSNLASELKDITNNIKGMSRSTTDIFKSLSNVKSGAFTSVATASESLAGNAGALGVVATNLERMQAALAGMQGMAGVVRQVSNGANPSATGPRTHGGGGSGASEADKLANAIRRLAKEAEFGAIKLEGGNVALLRHRAALLGASDVVEPFITRMDKAGKATNSFGMSTKQLNASMRGVPAQFTDIVVSLQGGQAPLTVLLQQGGQLKDMFGGLGNAMRAMGTYLLGLLTPVNLLAGAFAGLAYFILSAKKEGDEFRASLANTNGYVGKTATGLEQMAKGMATGTSSAGDMREALNLVAGSGKVTGENLKIAAQGAVAFAKATGTKVSEVVKIYEELANKPSSAILKLNQEHHFLTAAIYQQILALESQGKKQEAVTLAMQEFSKFASAGNKSATENMNLWSKVIAGWGMAYEVAGRQLNDFFRLTEGSRLSAMKAKLDTLDTIGSEGGGDVLGVQKRARESANALRSEIALIEGKIKMSEREATLKSQALEKEQRLSEYVSEVVASTGVVISREAYHNSLLAKRDEYLATNLSKREGGLSIDRLNLDIQKKMEEFDNKRETKAGKTLDKEAASLANRMKAYAITEAGLKTELSGLLKVGEEIGKIDSDEVKQSEHRKVAAELRQKLVNGGIKEEEAAAIGRQALLQDELADQDELNRRDQKALSNREKQDSITKKIYEGTKSQLEILREQDTEYAKLLEKSTAISDPVKLRLALLQQQTSELNKQGIIAAASGDPRQVVAADYAKASANIDKNIDPITMHAENLAAKDALDKQYEDKRLEASKQYFASQSTWYSTLLKAVDSLSGSTSSNLTGLLTGTTTLNQALNSLGNTILTSVVGSLVEWGTKEAWRAAISTTTSASVMAGYVAETDTFVVGEAIKEATMLGTLATHIATSATWLGTSLATAATEITAWISVAFAKLTASMAFLGPVAPFAAVGVLAAGAAAAYSLGSSMMHDNGGTIRAGEYGSVAEYGSELVSRNSNGGLNVTSRQETAKLLGGNSINIQVINNAGVNVRQSTTSKGDVLLILEEYLPSAMAGEMGNPKSKSVKALNSHTALNRR